MRGGQDLLHDGIKTAMSRNLPAAERKRRRKIKCHIIIRKKLH